MYYGQLYEIIEAFYYDFQSILFSDYQNNSPVSRCVADVKISEMVLLSTKQGAGFALYGKNGCGSHCGLTIVWGFMRRPDNVLTEVEKTVIYLSRQIRKQGDSSARTISALALLLDNFSKLKTARLRGDAPTYEELTGDTSDDEDE